MQEIINSLNDLPQTNRPSFNNHLNIWFLLDRIRGVKTLSAFYEGSNTGLISGIEYLVQNTPYAYLLEESPLLIKLSRTQLSDRLYQYIQQERSGLFIQSQADSILEQLQYLFIMQSEEQAQVFARFYDPIFWTALQLSSEDQFQNIWGNIDSVYTTTPHSGVEQLTFYTWTYPDKNKLITTPVNPIKLDQSFFEAEEEVKLLYFINEAAYSENIEITNEQLLHTSLNLKILVKNGIQRGDHLQKLLKQCITEKQFSLSEPVQNILQSTQADFKKTKQLLALA